MRARYEELRCQLRTYLNGVKPAYVLPSVHSHRLGKSHRAHAQWQKYLICFIVTLCVSAARTVRRAPGTEVSAVVVVDPKSCSAHSQSCDPTYVFTASASSCTSRLSSGQAAMLHSSFSAPSRGKQ